MTAALPFSALLALEALSALVLLACGVTEVAAVVLAGVAVHQALPLPWARVSHAGLLLAEEGVEAKVAALVEGLAGVPFLVNPSSRSLPGEPFLVFPSW